MNSPALEPMTLVYHELRAPLGLVATAARSAAEDCEDEELRSRCETIVRAAERMLRTANQLFNLNRLGESPGRSVYDPASVVAAIVSDLRGLEAAVSLEQESTGDEPRFACGAREPFEALIHSLIGNAIDHGEPGERIRVRTSIRGGRFEAVVENRIAARKRHRGLGLGSYIATELATQAGADLETSVEMGTYRAVVRLPLP
ncbi:MAG: sensor histidine kinase [Hyphomicrobiales bacterium]